MCDINIIKNNCRTLHLWALLVVTPVVLQVTNISKSAVVSELLQGLLYVVCIFYFLEVWKKEEKKRVCCALI